MPSFLLKYADARGQIHQQVAEAVSEQDLREKYTQQGFLIYSIKPRGGLAQITVPGGSGKKGKINVEKFLIFNQQFVTLIKAGLPILKGLDLLAERLTDPKLGKHIQAVRDEVKNGSLLSDAFAKQGVFPSIYVTSVMAGEKSGALAEVLERFIHYQRMAMAVKKKLLLSLMYPAILVVLVCCLIVFLVTYVVPRFAELYSSMQATLPTVTVSSLAFGAPCVIQGKRRASLMQKVHHCRRAPRSGNAQDHVGSLSKASERTATIAGASSSWARVTANMSGKPPLPGQRGRTTPMPGSLRMTLSLPF